MLAPEPKDGLPTFRVTESADNTCVGSETVTIPDFKSNINAAVPLVETVNAAGLPGAKLTVPPPTAQNTAIALDPLASNAAEMSASFWTTLIRSCELLAMNVLKSVPGKIVYTKEAFSDSWKSQAENRSTVVGGWVDVPIALQFPVFWPTSIDNEKAFAGGLGKV